MKIHDALNILGLPSTASPVDIKQAYYSASKKYHPDVNPAGLQMMKLVNAAYETLKGQNEMPPLEQFQEQDYGDKLFAALKAIIELNLTIEICGAWIWVSGQTRRHKEQLKSQGFQYAPQKQAWYFRPNRYRSHSRGSWSMAEIRNRYGEYKLKEEREMKKIV